MKQKFSCFWASNTQLSINGTKFLPEEAYILFPEHTAQIKEFVQKTQRAANPYGANAEQSTPATLGAETPALLPNLSNANKEKILKINAAANAIFEKLGIDQNSKNVQMEDLIKLLQYVVENSTYDSSIMATKQSIKNYETMLVNDVYTCLLEKRSVCTGDASTLSYLFRKLGVDSQHITIAPAIATPSHVHEVVLFNHNNTQYICDPTLTRTCLQNTKATTADYKKFIFKPNEFFGLVYPKYEIKASYNDTLILEK